MNPRLTPEIQQALMRRRMGGLSGGAGAPAQSQVMSPNPMGGPIGPSASPLQTSPQAMPSGTVPQPMPSSPGGPTPQGMDPNMAMRQMLMQAQGQGGAPTQTTTAGGPGSSDPNHSLMKALVARLTAGGQDDTSKVLSKALAQRLIADA